MRISPHEVIVTIPLQTQPAYIQKAASKDMQQFANGAATVLLQSTGIMTLPTAYEKEQLIILGTVRKNEEVRVRAALQTIGIQVDTLPAQITLP